jgi:heme exporter protein D
MEAAAAGRQGEWRIGDLSRLALAPLLQVLRRWWMQRIERHCLICADVEEQRARQAQQNVAYYQKQAAIARLAQQ